MPVASLGLDLDNSDKLRPGWVFQSSSQSFGRHFEETEDFSATLNLSAFVQIAYGCQQSSAKYHEAGDKRTRLPPNIPYWDLRHCQHLFILYPTSSRVFLNIYSGICEIYGSYGFEVWLLASNW